MPVKSVHVVKLSAEARLQFTPQVTGVNNADPEDPLSATAAVLLVVMLVLVEEETKNEPLLEEWLSPENVTYSPASPEHPLVQP